MSARTTTNIQMRPRWWQFIRRFREWRARRDWIGRVIVINGHPCKIVEWDGKTATLDRDLPPGDLNAAGFIIGPDDVWRPHTTPDSEPNPAEPQEDEHGA